MDWLFFFSFLIMKKKPLKNKHLLVQVYCQKRTHLGCQNISKHIETSDIDYIVVRGNYYFRVTKSYKRERIIISVLVHFRRNHWCMAYAFFFYYLVLLKTIIKKITTVAVFIFKKTTLFVWEYINTLKQWTMTILLFGEISLPRYKVT